MKVTAETVLGLLTFLLKVSIVLALDSPIHEFQIDPQPAQATI